MQGGADTLTVSDAAAELQRRVRELTGLYERHAYLIYNLALRTTCEREAAIQAAQRGFLDEAVRGGEEARLVAATIAVSLAEARGRPDPHGAGDPEAEAMLAAVASLEPAERAALALHSLAGSGPREVGQTIGIGEPAALELLERAHQRFAEALGVAEEEAERRTAEWLWAPPPEELWEETYPQLHRVLERGGGGSGRRAHGSGARGRISRRFTRPLLRGWALAGVFALLAGGIALAAVSMKDSRPATKSQPAPGNAGSYRPGAVTPTTPAPAAADSNPAAADAQAKLRAKAIRDAKRVAAAKRRARARARKRVAAQGDNQSAEFRRRALERFDAAQRQRALEQARERARRRKSAGQSPDPPPPPAQRPATSKPKPSSDEAPTKDEVEQRCLYNPDSGTYICPN